MMHCFIKNCACFYANSLDLTISVILCGPKQSQYLGPYDQIRREDRELYSICIYLQKKSCKKLVKGMIFYSEDDYDR